MQFVLFGANLVRFNDVGCCPIQDKCMSCLEYRAHCALGHKNKKSNVSDTFGKKAKCYAIFLLFFFNSENELSPMRFFFFSSFFLQPRHNVYVLCDIQKQKH